MSAPSQPLLRPRFADSQWHARSVIGVMIFDRPVALAHRGAPRVFVENTLAAVTEAVRQGADAVEVDVRVTRDGVAVLHHDRTLARLWRQTHPVADLTATQLRHLAPQVPTLEEAIVAVRGRGVPLVLDVGSVAAARAAVLSLCAHPGLDLRTDVWFCGDPDALSWLRGREVPSPRLLSWDTWAAPVAAMIAAVAPTMVNPWHRLVTPRAVRAWHDAGLAVCTWTVDATARRTRLLEWGVDAVISNDVEGTVRDIAEVSAARPRGCGPAVRWAAREHPARGR
jgi:glycerophosphoryl diester phosphodiesterase